MVSCHGNMTLPVVLGRTENKLPLNITLLPAFKLLCSKRSCWITVKHNTRKFVVKQFKVGRMDLEARGLWVHFWGGGGKSWYPVDNYQESWKCTAIGNEYWKSFIPTSLFLWLELFQAFPKCCHIPAELVSFTPISLWNFPSSAQGPHKHITVGPLVRFEHSGLQSGRNWEQSVLF